MGIKTAIFRESHFNSAHRLFNPEWSHERNLEVFGKCALPNYHGHNYRLIVKVTGEVNPETGFVMDMKELADLVKRHIEERFDHRNLNLDTTEFSRLNPTAENIAAVIYTILRPHIPGHFDLMIRLYETPRNFVEYPG